MLNSTRICSCDTLTFHIKAIICDKISGIITKISFYYLVYFSVSFSECHLSINIMAEDTKHRINMNEFFCVSYLHPNLRVCEYSISRTSLNKSTARPQG